MALGARAHLAERPAATIWNVAGQARRAFVVAPTAKTPSGKVPVVFSFHGHGDNIENFQYTEFQRAWREALVVYPQGLPSSRDRGSGWQVERGQDGDRDLKLVDVALAALKEQYDVDTDRIYATGFSNGAGFTYLLWAERPQVFAAFAPVATRMRPAVTPTVAKPIFHIAGVEDPLVDIDGQQKAVDRAKQINGLTGKRNSCGGGCEIYGRDTDTPVMFWVHAGGHVYPADTPTLIARFFRAYPLKR